MLLLFINRLKMIKRSVFLFCILVVLCGSASAQYDHYFYSPQKDSYKLDSLKYSFGYEMLGGDSISYLKVYPNSEPIGTVFLYHGYSGNLTVTPTQSLMRLLTRAGFQVYAFDYPGFGYSSGAPTHLKIYDDAIFFFRQWAADAKVTEHPILLYGQGIGAQVAASLASIFDGQAKAVVLDGSSPSFKELTDLLVPKKDHDNVEKFMKAPYSVKESVGELQVTKALFIHSKKDYVSYKDARKMFQKTSSQKDFWTYEGGHLESFLLYPDEFVRRFVSLLTW